jgi:photosystem II stability/assembly factor-like uncharacterized protein
VGALLAVTGNGLVGLADDGRRRARMLLERPRLACVAVGPRDPALVLAGGWGAGLHVSRDGGATWRQADLPERDVVSVAVSAADGAMYAGTEPSRLFRSADGARWEELAGLQDIPSRPTWSFPPRPWTSHVRAIAPDPHDAGTLLVGIELGGLMRSEDGGTTWADHATGAQRDVHALVWHPTARGRAYEAGGGGAALSVDGGRSWTPADEGREHHYCWAVAADPADAGRWWVSAAPGPGAAHGRGPARAHLYRRDGEAPWKRVDPSLPDALESMPYALAADRDGLWAGLGDGRVLESRDGGDSWSPLPVELGRVIAIAAVPA